MASLDELRRKVESGERLSEAELEALTNAARRDGGPSLRLALAHALLNAEANEQSLSMFERLVRDYPRDPQMLLGHARALAALERYSEAEKPVKAALGLQPQDPEALKVLAVLAMRRGEFARARTIVRDILRVDPFDEEARVLKEELEAFELSAQARGAQTLPSRGDFAEALAKALQAKGVSFVRSPENFILRLGAGKAARVDLTSLYEGYRNEPGNLQQAVTALAAELTSSPLELPDSSEALLGSVLPVLRPASFLDRARSAAHREGPAESLVFFVLEDPSLVRYVPSAALEARRLSIDEVDAAAWANLAARLAEPRPLRVEEGEVRLAEAATGLYGLCEEDGHDAARLLVHAQLEKIRAVVGEGPYRVGLRQREVALVCREADEAAVAMLEEQRSSPEGVGGRFRIDESGRLVSLTEWAG